MNWEVPVTMILVLVLAVEAILTLRPIADPASTQLDEDTPSEQLEQAASGPPPAPA